MDDRARGTVRTEAARRAARSRPPSPGTEQRTAPWSERQGAAGHSDGVPGAARAPCRAGETGYPAARNRMPQPGISSFPQTHCAVPTPAL